MNVFGLPWTKTNMMHVVRMNKPKKVVTWKNVKELTSDLEKEHVRVKDGSFF